MTICKFVGIVIETRHRAYYWGSYQAEAFIFPPLTISVHGRLEALFEPAGPALVPVRLVDGAAALVVALRLARVDPVPVDAPLEEPRATFKVKEGGNSNYTPFHPFYKYNPLSSLSTLSSASHISH